MAHSSRHILTVTVLTLALAAAYMLMGATAAGASPGLTVGIAGNQFIDVPEQAEASADGLGLGGVRVFIRWHGERSVSAADRLRLAHLDGKRSLITVYGEAVDTPKTPATRANYAAYLAQLVGLYHPWAVSVWNEPNHPVFWTQDGGAAESYTRLLARSYDAVERVDPAVIILGGETTRSYAPERWIRRMGAEYRTMRRSRERKLMDGFAHHPYPETWTDSSTLGNLPNRPLWLVQGDARRVRLALASAFRGTSQKRWTPVYWTETGWSTGSQAWNGAAASPHAQSELMAEATELAYCQTRVKGIFFFELWDDGPGGWHTGVLDADLNRKPSFDALANVIARVNAGNVDCARFPQASL